MSVTRSTESLTIPHPLGGDSGGSTKGSNNSVRSTRSQSTNKHGESSQQQQQSNNNLPALLQMRIKQQSDQLETLENMFHECEINANNLSYNEVLDNIELVKEVHSEFTKEHQDLIMAWPASHSEHHYFQDGPSKTEKKYYRDTLKILRKRQEQLDEQKRAAAAETAAKAAAAAAAAATAQPVQQAQHEQKPQLPKIDIPKFNGEYQNWPDFKVLFQELVSNRADIHDSAKLCYLKTAVANTKADIIGKITQSEGGFRAAWDMLEKRFENKRMMVWSYLERFRALSNLRARSASAIHMMHSIITETLEALKLAQVEDPADCILVYDCTQLLDRDTKELWINSWKDPQAMPKMSQFLDFLALRALTLEGLEASNVSHQSTSKPPPKRAQNYMTKNNYKGAGQDKRTPICDKCGGDHHIEDCGDFQDLNFQNRLQLTRDCRLCYICLLRHNGRDCTAPIRHCGYQGCHLSSHHRLLHGINMKRYFEMPVGTKYQRQERKGTISRAPENRAESPSNLEEPNSEEQSTTSND